MILQKMPICIKMCIRDRSCTNVDVRHDKSKLRILMCSSDRKEKGGMNSVICLLYTS